MHRSARRSKPGDRAYVQVLSPGLRATSHVLVAILTSGRRNGRARAPNAIAPRARVVWPPALPAQPLRGRTRVRARGACGRDACARMPFPSSPPEPFATRSAACETSPQHVSLPTPNRRALHDGRARGAVATAPRTPAAQPPRSVCSRQRRRLAQPRTSAATPRRAAGARVLRPTRSRRHCSPATAIPLQSPSQSQPWSRPHAAIP
mmetsp:Transcript_112658/g.318275  ORF Transcript_112658/g.318275 Transcript_112658/m.318275 type:complete len:206 (-) Transcript_112658:94-711(-)